MPKQLPDFRYLERYRNEGTRTYSSQASFTAADDRYRPDTTHELFELPFYEVPCNQLKVHTANPPRELVSKYLGGSRALFCIHPQLLEMCPGDPYVRQILSTREPAGRFPWYPVPQHGLFMLLTRA
jgi:hypothetical protein